jgi:hypothetical protein
MAHVVLECPRRMLAVDKMLASACDFAAKLEVEIV